MKIALIIALIIALSSESATTQIPSLKVMELRKYIDQSDSVLVVNFWATFCKPCVAEIPYYQDIIARYKSKKVKLLLVSLDLKDAYPHKLAAFASLHHFNSRIVWLNETNADYFCPIIDGKWSGVLPTTYFVNPKTGYTKLVEDQMDPKDFEAELLKTIKATNSSGK